MQLYLSKKPCHQHYTAIYQSIERFLWNTLLKMANGTCNLIFEMSVWLYCYMVSY